MRVIVAVACAMLVLCGASAQASEWRPGGLRPTSASLGDVQRAWLRATGTPDPGFAQRRERYRYRNGTRTFAVEAVFRGDDFRVALSLPDGVYVAGRRLGINWRADANGMAHGTLSDEQGDAADRMPRSLAPFAFADCSLAGEVTLDGVPAWVLEDAPSGDRPHWFFVDESTGRIVREETREGKRVVVTTFSQFTPIHGTLRPHHWRVADGDRANDLDVDVQAVVPGDVALDDVAIPSGAPPFASHGSVAVPVRFRRDGLIVVDVTINGRDGRFILDTGTASITFDSDRARDFGVTPVLEHASLARMTVAGVTGHNVSVLAIPLTGLHVDGILGYDFFFGHVVHIDYRNERVTLLDAPAAAPTFDDPHVTVVSMNVFEGLPLVAAQLGVVRGTRFALDTGSSHAYVLRPFAQRNAGEVARWSGATFIGGLSQTTASYLEGSIAVEAHTVSSLRLGPVEFTNPVIGVQVDDDYGDAVDMYFDGIVGTDELGFLDLWFDYDRARLALHPNGRR